MKTNGNSCHSHAHTRTRDVMVRHVSNISEAIKDAENKLQFPVQWDYFKWLEPYGLISASEITRQARTLKWGGRRKVEISERLLVQLIK
jgi:hypothetical protein